MQRSSSPGAALSGSYTSNLVGSAGSKLFERGYYRTPTATVVEGGSWLELWQILNRHNSRSLLVVGLYPRALVAALAWSRLHSRTTFYWSDTNIHDVLRQSGVQRSIRLISQRSLAPTCGPVPVHGKDEQGFLHLATSWKARRAQAPMVPMPCYCPPFIRVQIWEWRRDSEISLPGPSFS